MERILLVGRFQPFHKGHLFLLEQLSAGGRNFLEIAVGSTNCMKGGKNPFSWKERRRMILAVLKRRGLSGFRIFPVPDTGSDSTWLISLLKKARGFDYVVSGNPWVCAVFRRAGFEVRGHRFLKRKLYSGTEIRRRISSGNGWAHLVEREVVEIIEKGR